MLPGAKFLTLREVGEDMFRNLNIHKLIPRIQLLIAAPFPKCGIEFLPVGAKSNISNFLIRLKT